MALTGITQLWQKIATDKQRTQVWAYPSDVVAANRINQDVYLVERHPKSHKLLVVGHTIAKEQPPNLDGQSPFSVGVLKKQFTSNGELTYDGQEYCKKWGMRANNAASMLRWLLSGESHQTQIPSEIMSQHAHSATSHQEYRAGV